MMTDDSIWPANRVLADEIAELKLRVVIQVYNGSITSDFSGVTIIRSSAASHTLETADRCIGEVCDLILIGRSDGHGATWFILRPEAQRWLDDPVVNPHCTFGPDVISNIVLIRRAIMHADTKVPAVGECTHLWNQLTQAAQRC